MVSFFVKKKGIKTVPFWQSAPYQKSTIFQNSALGAPFSTKRLEKGHCFCCKKMVENGAPFGKEAPFWCPWTKGTVFAAIKKVKKWCRLVKGYYINRPWGTIFVCKKGGGPILDLVNFGKWSSLPDFFRRDTSLRVDCMWQSPKGKRWLTYWASLLIHC